MKRKRPKYHEHIFKNGKCVKCPMIESNYNDWKKLAKEVLTDFYGDKN